MGGSVSSHLKESSHPLLTVAASIDSFVVQITTMGIDRFISPITTALNCDYEKQPTIERNNSDTETSEESYRSTQKSCLKKPHVTSAKPGSRSDRGQQRKHSKKVVSINDENRFIWVLGLDDYSDEEHRATFVSDEELDRTIKKATYIAERERYRKEGERGYVTRGLEKIMHTDYTVYLRRQSYESVLHKNDLELYEIISRECLCEALWNAHRDAIFAKGYYAGQKESRASKDHQNSVWSVRERSARSLKEGRDQRVDRDDEEEVIDDEKELRSKEYPIEQTLKTIRASVGSSAGRSTNTSMTHKDSKISVMYVSSPSPGKKKKVSIPSLQRKSSLPIKEADNSLPRLPVRKSSLPPMSLSGDDESGSEVVSRTEPPPSPNQRSEMALKTSPGGRRYFDHPDTASPMKERRGSRRPERPSSYARRPIRSSNSIPVSIQIPAKRGEIDDGVSELPLPLTTFSITIPSSSKVDDEISELPLPLLSIHETSTRSKNRDGPPTRGRGRTQLSSVAETPSKERTSTTLAREVSPEQEKETSGRRQGRSKSPRLRKQEQEKETSGRRQGRSKSPRSRKQEQEKEVSGRRQRRSKSPRSRKQAKEKETSGRRQGRSKSPGWRKQLWKSLGSNAGEDQSKSTRSALKGTDSSSKRERSKSPSWRKRFQTSVKSKMDEKRRNKMLRKSSKKKVFES